MSSDEQREEICLNIFVYTLYTREKMMPGRTEAEGGNDVRGLHFVDIINVEY